MKITVSKQTGNNEAVTCECDTLDEATTALKFVDERALEINVRKLVAEVKARKLPNDFQQALWEVLRTFDGGQPADTSALPVDARASIDRARSEIQNGASVGA